MRYFVITSKHHDGFAMWHSKNPYNVVDATSFKRDIMKELRDACRKHGIHFGVYYSHAQEWYHEGGQRNKQDYPDHPTQRGRWHQQDKYIPHLVKTRQYVDEKAIPQLEEIITELQPEIIWFDTASWLPGYELNRIYIRARELDPKVIINSRVGRSFGDYKSTGDKPVDFPPVKERFWEAIPTTNESYGYHRLDNSHKPASHFITILTKCVAQGGNLLMNIGPKGDGSMAEKDQEILRGIGAWMDVNSAAIYGCGQAALPMQSWGYVTQGIREYNKKELFLHIDHWPTDGKLLVHGVKSIPTTVTALAQKKLKLSAEACGDHAIVIDLPKQALDKTMSVVRLEFAEIAAMEKGPQRLLKNIDANEIHVFYSDDRSKDLKNGSGTKHDNTLIGWEDKSQFISWDVYSAEPGRYRVEVLHYTKNPTWRSKASSCPIGKELTVTVGETILKAAHAGSPPEAVEPEMTGSHADGDSKQTDLATTIFGEVSLSTGLHRLTLRASELPKGSGFFPQKIRLVPVK